jgi:hypothetical protein
MLNRWLDRDGRSEFLRSTGLHRFSRNLSTAVSLRLQFLIPPCNRHRLCFAGKIRPRTLSFHCRTTFWRRTTQILLSSGTWVPKPFTRDLLLREVHEELQRQPTKPTWTQCRIKPCVSAFVLGDPVKINVRYSDAIRAIEN